MKGTASNETIKVDYTAEDIAQIIAYTEAQVGISIDCKRGDFLLSRIGDRIHETGVSNLHQYFERIQHDEVEREIYTNCITTNLTSFFRERHHFKALTETIVPEIMASRYPTRRLRIWSAACSTGEEPYSIAMALMSTFKDARSWDLKILATDIDTEVLRRAKRGVYPVPEKRMPDGIDLEEFAEFGQGARAGKMRMRQFIKDRVFFRRLNLFESWPMRDQYDVIFCRNVLIYFSEERQSEVISRMAKLSSDCGYLVLGHSERLPSGTTAYDAGEKTVYRRSA